MAKEIEVKQEVESITPFNGQQPLFSMDTFLKILEDIMGGEGGGLRRLCPKNGVSTTTFYSWIHADKKLEEAYKNARKFQSHALVDEALDDANEQIDGRSTAHAMMAKLRVDTKLKVAGMFNQEWYGKKVEEIQTVAVKHEMTDDQFLKIREAMLNKKKAENGNFEDAKIVE